MTTSRRRSSSLPWLFLLLLCSAAVGYAWKWFKQGAEKPRYQTVTLKREDLVQSVTATGQLTAVVNVQVGSQISGNIQKLHVDFNSPVKAGQVVAQIDAATYKANVSANEGELESARASVELARLTEKRKRQLVSDNAAPPADLEKAVADLNRFEDQTGCAGALACRSGALHHPRARGWCGRLTQCRAGADGGRELAGAGAFHHRQ